MNGFWAVCKRELKGYFITPIAYVFLVIFLFFGAYLTFEKRFFEARQANLQVFFRLLPWLFAFLVPATAMRLWAEERKSGSIELLFTLPITVGQAVLGKFVAAWLFLGLALSLTFSLPLTVAYLGNPDWGVMFTGYLASFLMAGAYLAIGCFFSAVSKNQVIAFILAVVACAILVAAGDPDTLDFLSFMGTGFVTFLEQVGFKTHFETMQRGLIHFRDVSYFILLIVGWLAACGLVLRERKES